MALELNQITHLPEGAETAPPLLVAHGLFGAARNFNTLGKRLAEGRRVVLVDMRNHGHSPWDADMSYPAMAADLARAVREHAGGRAAVLGHSMGGKAAMALALSEPELVAGLVVADIAPVNYAHSHEGYVAAMRSLDLSRINRRSDADPMLAGEVPEPSLRSFLLQNLVLDGGEARWRLNLGAIAANMGALLGFPDELAERRYHGPALFLHGGASSYVTPACHPLIRAMFPAAEIAALEGAGHWLHAEQPERFLEAVREWLTRAVDRGA